MESLEDRLAAAVLWEDPNPLFERLRQEAPVWRLPGELAYLVSSWELVAEATDRVADFSNLPSPPTPIGTPVGATASGSADMSTSP